MVKPLQFSTVVVKPIPSPHTGDRPSTLLKVSDAAVIAFLESPDGE
jgi:hypothetical protein